MVVSEYNMNDHNNEKKKCIPTYCRLHNKMVFGQHTLLINIEYIDCPLSYLDRLLRQPCKILQYQSTTFRNGKNKKKYIIIHL